MTIGSSQQMFMHELADMYNAEHQIVSGLQQMIPETKDQQLKQLFQTHLQQTQEQIQRLDQVWQLLGEQPRQVTCDGMKGILTEGKKNMKEAQTDSLRDCLMAGGADKVEHYEISSYTDLIMEAKLMRQQQIAQLLQENLQQEQWMEQQLTQSSPQLAQQAMAMEGQQGQATSQPSPTH